MILLAHPRLRKFLEFATAGIPGTICERALDIYGKVAVRASRDKALFSTSARVRTGTAFEVAT